MNISEAKKNYCSCIYCLSFPNGLSYVGKTKNLSNRMSLYERYGGSSNVNSAIDEFGLDNVDVSILAEVKCRNSVDLELCLSILEIKYIRELGTIHPNGYNVSFGGEVLSIPVEHLTTDSALIEAHSSSSKPVLLYDLDGVFVREYPSISRCAYDNGVEDDVIRNLVGKRHPFSNKWYLRFKRYDYIPKKIDVPSYEVRERVRYKTITETRVVEKELTKFRYSKALKYDMNGDFCGEFDSKSAACRTFIKNSHCGWGEYKNGYILFKKVSDDYPKKIEPSVVLSKKQLQEYYVPAEDLEDLPNNNLIDEETGSFCKKQKLCVDGKYTNIKHKFDVNQLTLGGDIIATFDSIRDASVATGIAYSQIYNCLKGRTKQAAGYKWAIADDGIGSF